MAIALALVQAGAAVGVYFRLASTAKGHRVQRDTSQTVQASRVSILIPVLNEANRLWPCLEGAIAQGPEVSEILVIDGGSVDGTQVLVQNFATRDARVRLVDARPVPADVNGKAHNLQVGYLRSSNDSSWILTLDADVRPDPMLVRSLLAHAAKEGVYAFSLATRQRLSGPAEALIHPSMLATLVYRLGIPGHATTRVNQIQANGQCFLLHRSLLNAVGGFSGVMRSINEDVTLARAIATKGNPVGFYESDDLITVEMYAGWRDAWQNWTRSLPMRDRFSDWRGDLGLGEILLVQALPPWVAAFSWWRFGRGHPLTGLNLALVIARIGVLQGIARAYEHRPWTYWLSPLCDLPVVLRIAYMSRRKRHVWRGRNIVAGDI